MFADFTRHNILCIYSKKNSCKNIKTFYKRKVIKSLNFFNKTASFRKNYYFLKVGERVYGDKILKLLFFKYYY